MTMTNDELAALAVTPLEEEEVSESELLPCRRFFLLFLLFCRRGRERERE